MNNLFEEKYALGLGGVAIGTAFAPITDQQSHDILRKAWDIGIRYFDTSPWYGLTRSEKRFGNFLSDKERSSYLLSTKVGRLFTPVDEKDIPQTMWKNPCSFDFYHDYTADGTKRSIDESLERLGVDSIDLIYVHDLSEDQVGDRYDYFMAQAEKGAFKVLSDYRDQGIIKGWGMGVNKIEPILDCMERADPDVCLSATQYSILEHEDAVDRLLPAVKKRGVKLVSGAGFNSGFLNGRPRYNYKSFIPKEATQKKDTLLSIAKRYNVDPVALAIQFVLADESFTSIIPGASSPDQVAHNHQSSRSSIPSEIWKELKEAGVIYQDAVVPL